ncbi:MAG: hypothetical protein K8H88_22750 [Sandaracinaceae bacterium]|nr:hypothetical protein [Sandaracinaceae bacterium]
MPVALRGQLPFEVTRVEEVDANAPWRAWETGARCHDAAPLGAPPLECGSSSETRMAWGALDTPGYPESCAGRVEDEAFRAVRDHDALDVWDLPGLLVGACCSEATTRVVLVACARHRALVLERRSGR